MLKSFKDAETQKIAEGKQSRRLPADIQATAFRKLTSMQAAISLGALSALPGNRFEALKGARKGQYSIRINRQWRICFRWTAEGAEEVEIVDYH